MHNLMIAFILTSFVGAANVHAGVVTILKMECDTKTGGHISINGYPAAHHMDALVDLYGFKKSVRQSWEFRSQLNYRVYGFSSHVGEEKQIELITPPVQTAYPFEFIGDIFIQSTSGRFRIEAKCVEHRWYERVDNH